MSPQEVIDFFETKVNAAARIGITPQAIDKWIKQEKIPRQAQIAIQAISKNKLVADKKVKDKS